MVLPAASRAVAVSVYVPFALVRESHVSLNLVGVDSLVTSPPRFCPLSLNCTPPISRSSTAVAVSVTVPVRVRLPTVPGENSETMGAPTSLPTVGWLAFHCATAVSHTLLSVVMVKQGLPLKVAGSACSPRARSSSLKLPAPSQTMTLFSQSASLPGGGPIHIPEPLPLSQESSSARKMLL